MNRDPRKLDDAIDVVATDMVEVRHDAGLAMRIVQSLPERRSRVAWLVPQLAAVSLAVLTLVLWNTRGRDTTTMPVLPSVAVNVFGDLLVVAPLAPAPLTAARENREHGRTQPLEPLEPVERLEPDFERALPAIAGPAAIPIGELTTVTLTEAPSLVVLPVVIAELPMTVESFIPRQ